VASVVSAFDPNQTLDTLFCRAFRCGCGLSERHGCSTANRPHREIAADPAIFAADRVAHKRSNRKKMHAPGRNELIAKGAINTVE
jgi:hypothetical protein